MRYALLTIAFLLVNPWTAVGQIDPELFGAMSARSIGPAGMSGRVGSVDAVASNPNIIFVGAATGGLWKSVDGGLTWDPIFDDQPASSIGAVAVNQSNPDIVWVGTGEGNPRNSAGVGRGIFKSMDGGDTWVHQGLENSERIHRIVLDPTNPNVAYAGVMGPAWSDGQERGVYRTTDGGATWERVLFVNERTGASDLVMDPSNPNKLFAGMWEHRRWPWFFESGGEGSGLYVTYDGGDTWTRITDDAGIPEGPLGRIGLAIARNNPNVVYAVVEATRSELIRSSDGGRSWETISDRRGVVNRPFYYADIRVDPENENRIYNLHSQIQVSEDQGRTFRTVVPSSKIHGDVQELWIHPEDGRRLIMGNDGGIGISYDRGATWRFVANLPIAQFYQINVDMERPYNVYGGMQDNGSWFGPSSVWHTGGIRNYDWMRVGGGDGFATMTDFSNTRYGYTESQQGFIRRFDKVTGERRDIRPVHPEGIPLRFNWNAALNVDPFDSTTIYLGSQFVHRSDDHGNSWEIISPDLTTNDPEKQRSYESGGLSRDASGAENHTAIMTIAPSPVEQGVIWVGTDDGNVQVTRDGGETWTNVIDRIRGVPNATWVAHIEPSKFDGATAFVVFDDHRRGNWESYVFKTTDYGNRWTNIATDDIDGFVHVIEQDPVAENLLFVGTEFGLFVSSNGGGSWFKWTHGVPTVPVRAAIVHPRDRDLVLGTHGRAAFVLDDIGPLREMALDPSIQNRALHAFEILDAQQHVVAEPMGYRSTGDAMFFGENREYGAMISYWRNTEGGDVDIVISATGDTIARLNGTTERGLNRITWDLRADGFRRPTPTGASEPGRGPEVYPFGDFTVTIRDGNETATAELAILADPRVEFTAREQESTLEGLVMIGQLLDQLAGAVEAVNEYNEAIGLVVKALEERGTEEAEALATQGRTLMDNLTEAAKKIADRPEGQGLFNTSHLLGNRVSSLYGSISSSLGPVTETQSMAGQILRDEVRSTLAQIESLLGEGVMNFRESANAAGLALIPEFTGIDSEWPENI